MSDPFVAEVRIFPYNFAPRGWAFCNGQLLPIAQNTPLFSLVGTTYGGNGQTTFGLPDLRGRTPLGVGQGPGLSDYDLGQPGGAESITLTARQLPNHTHSLTASSDAAAASTPGPGVLLATANTPIYAPAQNLVPMAAVGASAQPHANRQPFAVVNFCIALQGIFPTRD
jgi:microcystin-dependent protein